MVESEICIREEGGAMLVHTDYQGRVSPHWFEPAYWGQNARPVSSGGRGGAWFLQAGEDKLVLREYRRGGLMAKVSRSSYGYTCESEVRSFAEFRLLNQLVSLGLPVPRPVAAWYRKLSPIRYKAAIIIEQLVGTTPLAELLQTMDRQAWASLGRTVRKFHDAGVLHADLNCFNILVRGVEFFLIDFDKGAIKPASSTSGWKDQNLSRLHRSLVKVSGGESLLLRQGWQSFLAGYGQSS
ncbi:3-deoxy-D-manno-octulosonic acid kinase [Marinobacter sp. SS13-12]|uniref:3-deoxy-D-manno-octulosonic acid kinase n=1 Tax=Marinobacter sp. SS13-12 TaxID=3050451 RepID=UPI002555FF4A|nr:3-deoxy-D-manno-octulosonic acid kinase [Marinobacter sp. SS13-12]MDK8466027.1 3-deoxy-D-manno-octulosonic acid kinase [Marinobacter sp. SS13-12]